jgi:hypothetical protein
MMMVSPYTPSCFFRKKNYKNDQNKSPTTINSSNGMGCGATWVSLQGWGGRGKLGFPT